MNRYDESRALGYTNRLVKESRGSKDERDNDRRAKLAEQWFLPQYGLPDARPLDCDIVVTYRSKRGPVRTCIDLKWTEGEGNRLIVPATGMDKHLAKHGKPCTAYILLTGDPDQPDTMVAQGWAWGFHVLEQMQVERLPVPGYGLEQSDPRFRRNIDLLLASTLGVVRVGR